MSCKHLRNLNNSNGAPVRHPLDVKLCSITLNICELVPSKQKDCAVGRAVDNFVCNYLRYIYGDENTRDPYELRSIKPHIPECVLTKEQCGIDPDLRYKCNIRLEAIRGK